MNIFKNLLVCSFVSLLSACGSQDVGGGGDAGVNTGIKTAATAPTALLSSLAVLYPNGQLPAARSDQASLDLAQNPAALKLTADTANTAATTTTATTAKGQGATSFTSTAATATTVSAQAVAADYAPVQRVQNTTLYGAYFFSIYPTEITTALANNPNWALEGPAFWASLATGTDLFPVHRFRNKLNGSYLYSIYESERAAIADNYAATFEYEGVAWYARQTPATGWSALYRFRNKTNGTYLFSAYESEKDAIVRDYPLVFELEGVAYYVRQDAQPDEIDPTLPAITSISPVSPAIVVVGVATTYTVVGTNLPLTALLSIQDAACLAPTGNTATGFSQVCALNLSSAAGQKTITVKTAPAGTVINAMNTITAQFALTITGPTRVVANTLQSYSVIVANGTATLWNWMWGDASANSSSDPASKVWYKPGTYSTSVMVTANGVPLTTSQAVTVVANPVVAGDAHTCALKPDGTVNCWGQNTYGQLGDGTTTDKSVPTAVPSLSGVVALAAGPQNTCALKTDRTVTCWGYNAYGQLGDGTTTNKSVPTAVPSLSGVVSLATGANHTCVLKTFGTVSCWGANFTAQLGDGTTTDKLVPTAVSGLTGVVTLTASGNHTCALINTGTVSCWGDNITGGLGNGTTTTGLTPTAVPSLVDVVTLSAGAFHTCALKSNGTVSCWGWNANGQLGDGTITDKWLPTAVPSLTGVMALSAGLGNTCALKNDGTVSCWGWNASGQLGDGTITDKRVPTAVPSLTGVVSLAASTFHTCALKNDGASSCWGNNYWGNLGDGTVTNNIAPTPVVGGAVFWK